LSFLISTFWGQIKHLSISCPKYWKGAIFLFLFWGSAQSPGLKVLCEICQD
jgi:hypothetical protein